MPPIRPRGAYKKSESSRRQVLDAAMTELAKKGYAHTSVSDIAEAAGLSKGAVHYHFESKDDLIRQVLERCANMMRDRVREAWEKPGPPAVRLRRALGEMRAMRRSALPELRVLADLMVQAASDPSLREPIGEMFGANRREVVHHLAAAIVELGVRPRVAPEVIARLLLATLDGLALHDFFDPADEALEAQVQRAFENIAISLFEV